MNSHSDEQPPKGHDVERRRSPHSDDPEGPDQTAEPDGQFPDNNPDVGTIKAPPVEDPVPVKDPKPDTARPGGDQNTHGDSGGTS